LKNFNDFFINVRQRLDFYHDVQHLAAVGRAIHGEDKEKYRMWLKPLVRQFKNQSAFKVLGQLEEVLAQMRGERRLKRSQRSGLIP
jgi:hypothetical protein